jgi:octaprenyl-diphosphate synthase
LAGLSPLDVVRTELQAVERRMRTLPFTPAEPIPSAMEELLDAGGKRVRPALTLIFGKIFAAADEPLVSLAAAIEMVHTATLVHDDLVDNSHLRRGRLTANARWEPGAAVLVGDFLFAWAAQLASASGSTPVVQCFASALTTVVNGEVGQMFHPAAVRTLDQYLARIQAKTATLFEAACESPALLAGRPAEETRSAAVYGLNLGLAFQMTDDILDVTGDSGRTGKPAGSDLRQGLITLPTLCYLESHPGDPDHRRLIEGGRESAMADRLLESIRASDAVSCARSIAVDYAGKASEALADFQPSPYRSALHDLASIAVDREH